MGRDARKKDPNVDITKLRLGFNVAPFAAIHNLFLVWASFLMAAGMITEVIRAAGFSYYKAICVPLDEDVTVGEQFWFYVYLVTKFPELIDTALILLKGPKVRMDSSVERGFVYEWRQLSFLHTFHHAFVIFNSWMWLDGSVRIAAL